MPRSFLTATAFAIFTSAAIPAQDSQEPTFEVGDSLGGFCRPGIVNAESSELCPVATVVVLFRQSASCGFVVMDSSGSYDECMMRIGFVLDDPCDQLVTLEADAECGESGYGASPFGSFSIVCSACDE